MCAASLAIIGVGRSIGGECLAPRWRFVSGGITI